MASGDVMNTAARLQSAAPDQRHPRRRARRTRATRGRDRLPRGRADRREGQVASRCRSGRCVGACASATASRTTQRPLVGRETELERAARAWQTSCWTRVVPALAHASSARRASGRAGCCAEFAERRRQDGATSTGDSCLPYGEGITYWPVTEIVKSAAGILQSDDRDDDRREARRASSTDSRPTTATSCGRSRRHSRTSSASRRLHAGTYTAGEISQAELHWGICGAASAARRRAADRRSIVRRPPLGGADAARADLVHRRVDDVDARCSRSATARPELAETAPASSARMASGGRARAPHAGPTRRQPARASSRRPGAGGDAVRIGADRERRRQPALPRGDGAHAPRPGARRRGALAEASEAGDAAGSDEPPGPDQLATRPAREAEKQLAHHASVVGAVFWAGAVAHLGDAGRTAAGRSAPGPRRRSSGATSSSPVAVSTRRGRRRVRVQAHPDARRRVRTGAEGPTGAASRPVLGLGDDPPGQRRRVRRDRRLAPRAGVPALARSRAQPDRAADPPGRRRARERSQHAPSGARGLREAQRYYTRALDVLGDEHRRRAARAAPSPRRHHDDARRAEGGVRGARRGRRRRSRSRPQRRRVRGVAPARRHRPAAGARGRGAPAAR